MLNLNWFPFVGYSLLIWAVLPVLVTLALTFVITLVSDVELPMWCTAGIAALATGAWMGWVVGPAYGGSPTASSSPQASSPSGWSSTRADRCGRASGSPR